MEINNLKSTIVANHNKGESPVFLSQLKISKTEQENRNNQDNIRKTVFNEKFEDTSCVIKVHEPREASIIRKEEQNKINESVLNFVTKQEHSDIFKDNKKHIQSEFIKKGNNNEKKEEIKPFISELKIRRNEKEINEENNVELNISEHEFSQEKQESKNTFPESKISEFEISKHEKPNSPSLIDNIKNFFSKCIECENVIESERNSRSKFSKLELEENTKKR